MLTLGDQLLVPSSPQRAGQKELTGKLTAAQARCRIPRPGVRDTVGKLDEIAVSPYAGKSHVNRGGLRLPD